MFFNEKLFLIKISILVAVRIYLNIFKFKF